MFGLTPFNNRREVVDKNSEGIFDMERALANFFNDNYFPAFYSNSADMKVDIKDEGKKYVMEAELPGVNKDEVDIDVNENRMTISAEKKEQSSEELDNYVRKERRCSSMSRTFTLDNVDTKKISAKFKDGILKVDLPKLEDDNSKTRKIDIN